MEYTGCVTRNRRNFCSFGWKYCMKGIKVELYYNVMKDFVSLSTGVMKYYSQLTEGIMVDLRRDFWIRETGTGQQVAQLHGRYMMIMMMN